MSGIYASLNNGWYIFGGAAISFATVGLLIVVLTWLNYRQAIQSAVLRPRNDPMPAHPLIGRAPENAFLVFLGTLMSWATKMPHTVLMMGGDTMIAIDREKDSDRLILTALRIFDDRNNIIASVDRDGFWVKNTTRSKRPDPSTLV